MHFSLDLIFCICVNSLKTIINNLDIINFYNISFLCNNMIESFLLEDCTTSQYNYTLITIVTLKILYYAQKTYSNIVQKVNIQFSFANNVLK